MVQDDFIEIRHIQPNTSMSSDVRPYNSSHYRERFNCLAYALDAPGLGFAWPGRIGSGRAPFKITVQDPYALNRFGKGKTDLDDMLNLMQLEGLEVIGKREFDPTREHIIAYDHDGGHFYRLNVDGRWTHKPSTHKAVNLSVRGDVITDPEDEAFKRQLHLMQVRSHELRRRFGHLDIDDDPSESFDVLGDTSDMPRPKLTYLRFPEHGLHAYVDTRFDVPMRREHRIPGMARHTFECDFE